MAENTSTHVLYVEPNYQHDSFPVAYRGVPPLEDYCIAFQLAVEVPSIVHSTVSNTNSNTVIVLTYKDTSAGTAVSLLQGTRIIQGSTKEGGEIAENVLTTAALDTHLQDVKETSPTELFGVKSIDISYDTWSTPIVNMKLTDVRGAGLFAKEELKHPGNGVAVDDIPGSFFRCFFVQPYPLFGMVVKGFYGEAVSYEMRCSKFNFKLDSATGNFDVDVQFIGYTWSILGDVTLNSICVIPYCTFAGKEYWDSQKANGRFTVDGGKPMPTLAKIINSFQNIKNLTKPIPQLDVEGQQVADMEAKNGAIEQVTATARSASEAMYENAKKMFGAQNVRMLGSASDGFVIDATSNLLHSNHQSFTSLKNESDKYLTEDFWNSLQNSNLPRFPSNFHALEGDDFEDGIKKLEPLAKVSYDVGNNSVKDIVFTDFFKTSTLYSEEAEKAITEIIKDPKQDNGDYSSSGKTDRIILCVNLKSWCQTLTDEAKTNREKTEEAQKELEEKMKQQIASVIGMKPTIYNIMKVIMAHLETLVYSVYNCEASINPARTISSSGLANKNYTTGCQESASSGQETETPGADVVLPPFPECKKKETKNGQESIVDEWLGNVSESDELVEVEFIEAMLRAVAAMAADVNAEPLATLENPDGSQLELKVKCPVVPSDLFIPGGLFDTANISDDNIADTMGVLALRAGFVLNAFQDISKNADTAGEIDALNWYAAYQGSLSTCLTQVLGECDEDKFYDMWKAIVQATDNNSLGDWKRYVTSGLPWLEKGTKALTNVDGLQLNYPTNADTLGYPYYSLSFAQDGLGKTGTVTNDYSKFSMSTASGSTEIKLLGNPSVVGGAAAAFDDAQLADISGTDDIKDNFEKLASFGVLSDDSYKGKFNERHDMLNRTYASTNQDKTTNGFAPSQYGVQGIKNGSLTLPSSANMITDNYKTAFDCEDKDEKEKRRKGLDEMTSVHCFNGVGDIELKRKKEDSGEFFKNANPEQPETINNWTVPRIMGVDGNGAQDANVSIFMQQPYITGTTEDKAVQFLGSFCGEYGIKMDKCLDDICEVNSNGQEIFAKVPYFAVLLIGAACYYMRNPSKFTKQFGTDKTYKGRALCVFAHHDLLKIDGDKVTGGKIKDWSYRAKEVFGKAFQDWLTGNFESGVIENLATKLSFKEIDAALSLNLPIETAKEFAKRVDDTVNSNLVGTFNSLEKYLKQTTPSIFDNYISVLPAKDDYQGYCCRLYTRETSEIVKKLTALYIQPVLVVPFNEWLQLDGNKAKRTSESSVKDYIKGFCKRLQKISEIKPTEEQKEGEQQGDQAGAGSEQQKRELEKHIKITLYTYVKRMYDNWLSAHIYDSTNSGQDTQTSGTTTESSTTDENTTDEQTKASTESIKEASKDISGANLKHWSLEEFFEKHFHFIDQYYVKCDDLFFNMEQVSQNFSASFEQEALSLISFIQSALSSIRCVLYPVQNFMNYYSPEGQRKMENLFKPLSYNEAFANAPKPTEIYPDFVCLYSSEPSKKVNGDDCGDSYDLSQPEVFLPLPIRKKSDTNGNGRIPCFGVSYGSQYQSYFKTIDVSTDSPLPTEQSLKAEYAIASAAGPKSGEDGKQMVPIGQDLYTIYSNQSYTCTVTMMGDMWVQPLSQFVLTNIPTFRGTYLIQKVYHNIVPGNMTTKFVGVRMANTQQPKTDNWYVGPPTEKQQPKTEGGSGGAGGDGSGSGDGGYYEDTSYQNAGIDNKCQYKVFGAGGEYDGSGGWTDAMLNSTMAQFVSNPNWESNPNTVRSCAAYQGWQNETMINFIAAIANREYRVNADNGIGFQLVIAAMFDAYTTVPHGGKSPSILSFVKTGWVMIEEYASTPQKLQSNGLYPPAQAAINEARDMFLHTPAKLLGKQTKAGTKSRSQTSKGNPYSPSVEMQSVFKRTPSSIVIDNINNINHWAWPSVIDNRSKNGFPNYHLLGWDTAIEFGNHIYITSTKDKKAKWSATPKQPRPSKDKNETKDQLKALASAISQTFKSITSNAGKTVMTQFSGNEDILYLFVGGKQQAENPDNALLFDIVMQAYQSSLNLIYWVATDSNSYKNNPKSVAISLKYKGCGLGHVGAEGLIYIDPKGKKIEGLQETFIKIIAKKYGTDVDTVVAKIGNFGTYKNNKNTLKEKLATYTFADCPQSGHWVGGNGGSGNAGVGGTVDIPPGSSAASAKLLKEAEKYLGTPYGFGNCTPKVSMDCSCFVRTAYKDAGYKLEGTACNIYENYATPIEESNAIPGDLIVFSRNESKNPVYCKGQGAHVGHIGILVDKDKKTMIHSGKPNKVAPYNDSYFTQHFIGFGANENFRKSEG